MLIKTLPLIFSAAIALAAPITDVAPDSENILRVPIFNRNPIDLNTVHAMDKARWAPLGNIDVDNFTALAESGYIVNPAINELTSYTLVCALGTPHQNLELIFDSGSAILWVQPAFYDPDKSSSHEDLDETFEIEYGSASTSGTYHSDLLSLGNVSVTQDFGIADQVAGLGPNSHGIIGVGPNDLTRVTNKDRIVPTPLDNLVSAGKIKNNVYGVYFERMEDGGYKIRNGEVIFGGYDTSRYSGDLIWADPPKAFPENAYWGFNLDKVTFGDTVLVGAANGISDTGTSLILFNPASFLALMKSIPGSSEDKGMITFPTTSLKYLKPLTFVIKGKALTILPEQYTLEPKETLMMQGDPKKSYIWIGEDRSSSKLSVILGQKFLEHFYSVYDGVNNRVGFAPVKARLPTPETPATEVSKPTPPKNTTPAPCDQSKICCRIFGSLNPLCCKILGGC
ncbi:hypothetical protein MVEG_03980 [Podila verticillata NRRL 6337]|nr:hypothetical protein MVEG_03980 [Podila verticillata NRRL 6337]